MQIYRARQGDNLSLIISAYYGTITSSMLSQVLLANQNIADVSSVLPPGTRVCLPILFETDADVPVQTLWD